MLRLLPSWPWYPFKGELSVAHMSTTVQSRMSAPTPDHCIFTIIVSAVTTDFESAHGGFMGRPQPT